MGAIDNIRMIPHVVKITSIWILIYGLWAGSSEMSIYAWIMACNLIHLTTQTVLDTIWKKIFELWFWFKIILFPLILIWNLFRVILMIVMLIKIFSVGFHLWFISFFPNKFIALTDQLAFLPGCSQKVEVNSCVPLTSSALLVIGLLFRALALVQKLLMSTVNYFDRCRSNDNDDWNLTKREIEMLLVTWHRVVARYRHWLSGCQGAVLVYPVTVIIAVMTMAPPIVTITPLTHNQRVRVMGSEPGLGPISLRYCRCGHPRCEISWRSRWVRALD